MHETTTEAAAALRKAYKAQGWNSRSISVRTEYFSMGSSISVTVKDASVDFRLAEDLAKATQQISRCEITHEILGGGNRYLSFGYSAACEKIIGAPYVDGLRKAITEALLRIGGNYAHHSNIDGCDATLNADCPTNGRIWSGESSFADDSHSFAIYPHESCIDSIAFQLGCKLGSTTKKGVLA